MANMDENKENRRDWKVYLRYMAGPKTRERLNAMRVAESLQKELLILEKSITNIDTVEKDLCLLLSKVQGMLYCCKC